MVTEPDGTFITARQFPQMVRFASPLHDGLPFDRARRR